MDFKAPRLRYAFVPQKQALAVLRAVVFGHVVCALWQQVTLWLQGKVNGVSVRENAKHGAVLLAESFKLHQYPASLGLSA